MSMTRRKFLQFGSAVGAAALAGARTTAHAQSGLATRPIPSSGERIPVVGVGTNRYRSGDPAYVARLRDTLAAFARLGGGVVDTAPAYGDSESVIGGILRETDIRERLFLATKVDRDSVSEGRARIDASFQALGARRLDLVQLHNLRGADALLGLLRELKADGRIRYIGITSSSDGQYGEMEAIMRRERLDFIQVDYAVGNRGDLRDSGHHPGCPRRGQPRRSAGEAARCRHAADHREVLRRGRGRLNFAGLRAGFPDPGDGFGRPIPRPEAKQAFHPRESRTR